MANTGNQPIAGNTPASGTNFQPQPGVNSPTGRNNRAGTSRGRVGKKDNIQKFFSKNGFLIGVIVVIIVSMGAYYWHAYKKYKQSEEALEMSKIPNVCPDYWVNDSGKDGRKKTLKCKNVESIGVCNLSEGNRTKDFSGELYKDPMAKCNWSKFCNAPWEGYDHLCADV